MSDTHPPDAASADRPTGAPPPDAQPDEPSPAPAPPTSLQRAEQWIDANRSLALLGAFATGVFLGVMLRD